MAKSYDFKPKPQITALHAGDKIEWALNFSLEKILVIWISITWQEIDLIASNIATDVWEYPPALIKIAL